MVAYICISDNEIRETEKANYSMLANLFIYLMRSMFSDLYMHMDAYLHTYTLAHIYCSKTNSHFRASNT